MVKKSKRVKIKCCVCAREKYDYEMLRLFPEEKYVCRIKCYTKLAIEGKSQ